MKEEILYSLDECKRILEEGKNVQYLIHGEPAYRCKKCEDQYVPLYPYQKDLLCKTCLRNLATS